MSRCINEAIPGWMSHEELAWLHYQSLQYYSIVEVGSWMGRSTYPLLTGCPGTVIAVDHFQGSPSERETNHREVKTEDIYLHFMSHVGHFRNLRVIKESSEQAVQQFEDNSIEFGFIDADHDNLAFCNDLTWWYPKCKKLFAGHDRDIADVARGLQSSGLEWKEGPGSIWYVQKG